MADVHFSSLGINRRFSRSWHQLHIFPRLATVPSFPVLGTNCMLSRTWYQLHVFPRLVPVACFPAPGTSCMFSSAEHQLINKRFPRLAPCHWARYSYHYQYAKPPNRKDQLNQRQPTNRNPRMRSTKVCRCLRNSSHSQLVKRTEKKAAKVLEKVMARPRAAHPMATPTMFCSATKHSIWRPGNFFLQLREQVEFLVSPSSAITRSHVPPSLIRPLAYARRTATQCEKYINCMWHRLSQNTTQFQIYFSQTSTTAH